MPRFWPKTKRWTPALALLLLLVDLFRAQQPRHFTHINPLANFQYAEVLAVWAADDASYRVDFTPAAADDLRFSQVWAPLTGMINDREQAFGLPWNPFDMQSFADFYTAVSPDSPFYDFLGVKYLVARQGERLSAKWEHVTTAGTELVLYENRAFRPKATVVFTAVVEPDQSQVLQMIRHAEFDPQSVVLLAEGDPFSGQIGMANVQIVEGTNNSLSLRVISDQPGYLVVSDVDYPGWRATVNDRPTPILRANGAFRALFVEAGETAVQFEYQSMTIIWGAAVSLTVWAAAGLTLILNRGRRYRRKRREIDGELLN